MAAAMALGIAVDPIAALERPPHRCRRLRTSIQVPSGNSEPTSWQNVRFVFDGALIFMRR